MKGCWSWFWYYFIVFTLIISKLSILLAKEEGAIKSDPVGIKRKPKRERNTAPIPDEKLSLRRNERQKNLNIDKILAKDDFNAKLDSSIKKKSRQRKKPNRPRTSDANTPNQFLFNGLNRGFYRPESYSTLIPTYYVDPYILLLSNQRFLACGLQHSGSEPFQSLAVKDLPGMKILGNHQYQFTKEYFHYEIPASTLFTFAIKELQMLYESNAIEYFRGHELVAYHYFVEYLAFNPHYQLNFLEAEMEYLPILPLHWKAMTIPSCSYGQFIQYLLTIQRYLEQRDQFLQQFGVFAGAKQSQSGSSRSLPLTKFIIASTYNMRTMWGYGLASQQRKGYEYQTITSFVQNISVGHYERWPQCPDLLRKWWKYVVELPYLPLTSRLAPFEDLILREVSNIEDSSSSNTGTTTASITVNLNIETMNLFNPINTFSKYQNLLKQREEAILESINHGITSDSSSSSSGPSLQQQRRVQRKLQIEDFEKEGAGEVMNLMGAPNEDVFQVLQGNSNNSPGDGGPEAGSTTSATNPDLTNPTAAEQRRFTFLFIGNLEMVGPNKVCSIRSVLQSLLPRDDLLMIHIPLSSPYPGNEPVDEEEVQQVNHLWTQARTVSPASIAKSPVHPKAVYSSFVHYMEQSTFCLITASTSYSSAFFYHAMENDCIPIVINDWFVFSFPWIIAYETFVIRIAEADFLRAPDQVLTAIKEKYLPIHHYHTTTATSGTTSTTTTMFQHSPYHLLLNNMRKAMLKMKLFCSYDTITYQSNRYEKLLFADIHYYYNYHYNPQLQTSPGLLKEQQQSSQQKQRTTSYYQKVQTVIPMELFLLELRYAQHPYKYYNNIPCLRPLLCNHRYDRHYYRTLTNSTSETQPSSNSRAGSRRSLAASPRKGSKANNPSSAGAKTTSNEPTSPYQYQTYTDQTNTTPKPGRNQKSSSSNSLTKQWSNQVIEKIIQSRYLLLFNKVKITSGTFYHPSNVLPSLHNLSTTVTYGVTVQSDAYQVNAVAFDFLLARSGKSSPTIDDRPYLCKHHPRLIGTYKIVYFMQCVRVLWTLNPGKFKPQDLSLLPVQFDANTPLEARIRDDNSYHHSQSRLVPLQKLATTTTATTTTTTGLTLYERDYILAFHNLSRPAGWKAVNYPHNPQLQSSEHSHILTYDRIVGLGNFE